MFTLYRNNDFHRKCSLSDYALVMSPRESLEQVIKNYDLDPKNYSHYGAFELPKRLIGKQSWHLSHSYTGYDDPVYETIKQELNHGWLIGIVQTAKWDASKHPFFIDDKGSLVCRETIGLHSWFIQEIMNGYKVAVANNNGVTPPSTQRISYGYSEPEQRAQAAKTINSKAAGRLLAAGGIYNGNIEGFHQTAKQLGGDAPAGYDQIMDNKGLLIAGASVAAGLGIGRLGNVETLSKIPFSDSGAYSPAGRIGNPLNVLA